MSSVFTARKGYSLLLKNEEQARRLLPLIRDAGFEGVEPTFTPGAFPSPEGWEHEAPLLREMCDELGLCIPSMRGGRPPWNTIPDSEKSAREQAAGHTERALSCLEVFGGDVLLIVPGQSTRDVHYLDHWDRVIEYARAVAPLASQRGMSIGLENTEARFPLSLRDWRDLMGEIADPAMGVYLDVGNITWLGLGYPHQWISTLAPWIKRVHFKDATFGGVLRNLLAGDVPWAEVMQELRRINYRSWISVEPEWYRSAPWRLPERLYADLEALFQL